jgi:predicted dinucleotide-binding enzyme
MSGQRLKTTSELIAGHLRDARLVKAFNAILAKDLDTDGTPSGTPNRRALPIAGDDGQAKRQVSAFMDQCGFDAVDAGAQFEGWRFERAKPAYCIRLHRAALQKKLAEAERDIEFAHGSWCR